MRKLVYKAIILAVIVYSVVIGVNYFIDPANLYHNGAVNKMVEYLNVNKIVKVPANIDESVLQEKRISSMDWKPETVVIGSSHVMYIPFEYEQIYNAGMSGSYLGDYYSIVGLLKYYNKMPRRVIIGVDPWAFMRSAMDGRHTEIKQYALYLQDNMNAADKSSRRKEFASKKIKEMVSFSYFQASVDSFKKNGLRKPEEAVEQAVNDKVDNSPKMLVDGRRIPAAKDYHSVGDINQEIDKTVEKGKIYQLGAGFQEIQKENIRQFEELLEYLLNNGVEVHIYLPAWHPKVYKHFCDDESFSGVNKIELKMRRICSEHNIPIHGGYDPSVCGITEDDFMDWLHLKPEKMLENYNYVR